MKEEPRDSATFENHHCLDLTVSPQCADNDVLMSGGSPFWFASHNNQEVPQSETAFPEIQPDPLTTPVPDLYTESEKEGSSENVSNEVLAQSNAEVSHSMWTPGYASGRIIHSIQSFRMTEYAMNLDRLLPDRTESGTEPPENLSCDTLSTLHAPSEDVAPTCALLRKKLTIKGNDSNFKYACADCPKIFSCSSNLRKHRRVHTGERPFACKECGRTFACSSNLSRHALTHHMTPCSRCQSTKCSCTMSRLHLDESASEATTVLTNRDFKI